MQGSFLISIAKVRIKTDLFKHFELMKVNTYVKNELTIGFDFI